jgi:hypothetical protein
LASLSVHSQRIIIGMARKIYRAAVQAVGVPAQGSGLNNNEGRCSMRVRLSSKPPQVLRLLDHRALDYRGEDQHYSAPDAAAGYTANDSTHVKAARLGSANELHNEATDTSAKDASDGISGDAQALVLHSRTGHIAPYRPADQLDNPTDNCRVHFEVSPIKYRRPHFANGSNQEPIVARNGRHSNNAPITLSIAEISKASLALSFWVAGIEGVLFWTAVMAVRSAGCSRFPTAGTERRSPTVAALNIGASARVARWQRQP